MAFGPWRRLITSLGQEEHVAARAIAGRRMTVEGNVAKVAPSRHERGLRSPFGGGCVLAALFLHLSATKSGSYISIPGTAVFLADLLLVFGILVAVAQSGTRVARLPLLASAVLLAYALLQVVRTPAPFSFLTARDVAPLLYLALVPFLAVALQGLRPVVFLRVVRAAVLVLAAGVLLREVGVLPEIQLGAFSGGVPLFSPREDVEGVVLGLGVLAFGRYGNDLRGWPVLQGGLAALAAVNYSRAGLLAVLVCCCVAAWRDRSRLRNPTSMSLLMFSVAAAAAGVMVLLGGLFTFGDYEVPSAVGRLLSSDSQSGTTGARLKAWALLLRYTEEQQALLLGLGPGTTPVSDSGAVGFLSGNLEVRAAHNWVVSAVAYLGVAGLVVWVASVMVVLLQTRRSPLWFIAATGVAAYCLASLFGVVIESPFGSLPVAVLLAALLATTTTDTAGSGRLRLDRDR